MIESKPWISALLAIVFFLCTLEFVAVYFDVPAFLLPAPSAVFMELSNNTTFFLEHTAITAFEATVGFALGNSFAFLLAALLVSFPKFEGFGLTLGIILKAIPIIVLAPVFVIWFGNGIFGKCLMAALVCFFPMLVNGIAGLKTVDSDTLRYTRTLRMNRVQVLWHIRVPYSLPFVVSAAKISSTVAIVGAIVAELAGADKGIGYVLLYSVYYQETTRMFAGVFCITMFGLAMYGALSILESYLKAKKLD